MHTTFRGALSFGGSSTKTILKAKTRNDWIKDDWVEDRGVARGTSRRMIRGRLDQTEEWQEGRADG